jgi:hypothetical protein
MCPLNLLDGIGSDPISSVANRSRDSGSATPFDIRDENADSGRRVNMTEPKRQLSPTRLSGRSGGGQCNTESAGARDSTATSSSGAARVTPTRGDSRGPAARTRTPTRTELSLTDPRVCQYLWSVRRRN